MKRLFLVLTLLATIFLANCIINANSPECVQKLLYQTNKDTAGEQALREAGAYHLGDYNNVSNAVLATTSESLILSETEDQKDLSCSPFNKLVKEHGYQDMFSLQLCGFHGPSKMLLGGIDPQISPTLRNFIPITDEKSDVVPALYIRRADNKKYLANFEPYDPSSKQGIKTIIDSSTAFTMLPPALAEAVTDEIKERAEELGLSESFPGGFFRLERGTTTKLVRFANLKQIRQFPTFEIGFLGTDGQKKHLLMAPIHYFKEMDSIDLLVRTFGFRESAGDIVLGQSFLENYYTFFDRKNSQVGFGDIDLACKK